MENIEYIKKRFISTSTIHRTIGKDNTESVLECGFMRKPEYTYSDIDIEFKYYGGVLVIDGEGTFINSDKSEIPIYPGCFIQRLPDMKHSTIIKSDGKWIEAFICFGRGLYFFLQNIGVINKDRPVLYPGLDMILIKKIVSIYDDLLNTSQQYLPYLLLKAQEIVLLAHELDENNREGIKNGIIRQACRIIDQSDGININVQKLSEHLYIGYEVFRKLFKENTGISPNAYVIQRRINSSKSMLLNNQKSIKEIAINLDYPDQFSFSKQFKQITGMNPSEFRSQFI